MAGALPRAARSRARATPRLDHRRPARLPRGARRRRDRPHRPPRGRDLHVVGRARGAPADRPTPTSPAASPVSSRGCATRSSTSDSRSLHDRRRPLPPSARCTRQGAAPRRRRADAAGAAGHAAPAPSGRLGVAGLPRDRAARGHLLGAVDHADGRPVAEHGVVGNGWYFRDLGEVLLWRQHNALVEGEKVWQALRRAHPGARVANVCWWYAMGMDVDSIVTPRPIYHADGRKSPDCYTRPAALHDRLTERLGDFPLFHYWGPTASIASSRWIIEATRIAAARARPHALLRAAPRLRPAALRSRVAAGPGRRRRARRRPDPAARRRGAPRRQRRSS